MRNTVIRLAGFCLITCAVFSVLVGALAQERRPEAAIVYVVPIDGVVDLGLAPYVRRILQQAQDDGASAVVLEINTFGGRVDAAVQIRDAVLTAPVQTVAFINKRAISAGALIALAAEKIVMAGGGTIGAARRCKWGSRATRRSRLKKRRCRMCARNFARPPRAASGRR
jgi:membrane-bound serine protease (ClpP class)